MLESVAYGLDIAGDSEEGNVSTDDVEKLLDFQVEQMQSEYTSSCGIPSSIMLMCAEYGNRIPFEVKDSFRSVLEDSIMVPSLSHYLKYVPFHPPSSDDC
jgi:anaphase-promoting complex subunit 5